MKKYIIQIQRVGSDKVQRMTYDASERGEAYTAWDNVVDAANPGDRCELIVEDGNSRVINSAYYPCDRNYPYDRGHE